MTIKAQTYFIFIGVPKKIYEPVGYSKTIMQPEPISLKYGTELPVCIDLAVEGQQAEQGYPFPSLRLLLSLPFSVKIPKVT